MTLFDELKNANLPVISANDNGSVVMDKMTDEQEAIYNDIILSHFQPSTYQVILLSRADKLALRQEFINMIARLDQIQAATNPTNAQVVQAVKDEALYIERIMRFIARTL